MTYFTNLNIDKKSNHNVIKYRSFKKFDELAFQSDLLYSGLEHLETVIDPNDALNVFYDILNNTLSKHAPMKEKRVKYKHQVDWFTQEIKSSILERDYCKKVGNHSSTKFLEIKYQLLKRVSAIFLTMLLRITKTPVIC